MEFGLAIIANIDQSKTELIDKLAFEIKGFLKNKNYGNDIKAYTIGVVCVAPQFEQFFKDKKPKYTKGKKSIIQEGFPFTLEDSFEYDIKLDFETFKNGTEEECRKLLAREIMNSLTVLDDMKKKIKDFDSEKFKADLEDYFKKKGLM